MPATSPWYNATTRPRPAYGAALHASETAPIQVPYPAPVFWNVRGGRFSGAGGESA